MKAKSTFSVLKWDESTYKEIPASKKLTKASVLYDFKGDLEGKVTTEYLMCYTQVDPKDQHLSTATYIGLLHFEGTLAGHSGSFVMKDEGKYQGGISSNVTIVEGSGTSALQNIKGVGKYQTIQGGMVFELEYEL